MQSIEYTKSEGWVEVRVPTYKRNVLLLSCLSSIINQTWQQWRAIVFDDASDNETREVVDEIGDWRICYRANAVRLGAAGNLNQCFQTKGYYAGSLFACCLEDDNWMYPHAIETNIQTLISCGGSIMMRNQDIFKRSDDDIAPTKQTTLGPWFAKSAFYGPVELAARSMFYTGISNGALFWRTNSISSLQDPSNVVDPSLQEYIRCWQIQEPLYVRLDSALAYSDPEAPTFRHYTKDKSFSRAIQHGGSYLLRTYGHPFLSYALECAIQYQKTDLLTNSISNLGSFDALLWLFNERLSLRYRSVMRGIVKKLLVKSPLKHLP